jgi:hypothetical protein
MIHDEGGANISGTTVNVNSSITMSQIEYHAKLHNMGSSAKLVKVKRYKLNVGIFAINDFCWTSCYDPSTDVSPFGITVPAGATDTNFVTHYTHGEDVDGVSTYRFTFYDAANVNDSVSFIINFNITVGINEAKANAIVSTAFPNPASTMFSLKYELNQYVQTAKIVVYDMLGKVVKIVDVNDRQGTAKVYLEELNSGVYFYSFMVNDKAVSTKKIVISSK